MEDSKKSFKIFQEKVEKFSLPCITEMSCDKELGLENIHTSINNSISNFILMVIGGSVKTFDLEFEDMLNIMANITGKVIASKVKKGKEDIIDPVIKEYCAVLKIITTNVFEKLHTADEVKN